MSCRRRYRIDTNGDFKVWELPWFGRGAVYFWSYVYVILRSRVVRRKIPFGFGTVNYSVLSSNVVRIRCYRFRAPAAMPCSLMQLEIGTIHSLRDDRIDYWCK